MGPADDPRIAEADALLAARFAGRYRDHGPPAVVHPRRVAARVAESFEDARVEPSLVVAALLHDLVEDTDVGLHEVGARFGDDVRALVDWVTKRPGETKAAYLGRLGGAPADARRLKVCDRVDNLRDVLGTSAARAGRYLDETRSHVVPLAHDLPAPVAAALEQVMAEVSAHVAGQTFELEAPASPRVAAAIARADGLFAGAADRPVAAPRPHRVVAFGDPQCSAPRFFAMLDAHGLLGDDGWLAPDAAVVSLGDHFDFGGAPLALQRREGCRILGWLSAHAPAQARILLGNHDLARVTELCGLDDVTFACANALGRLVRALERRLGKGAAAAALTERFHASFPAIPTPEVAARDHASFGVVQRELLVTLLLRGRLALGLPVAVAGAPALCVHAGLTAENLGAIGAVAEPGAVASALDRHLGQAVARVRCIWEDGGRPPLELGPLHVPGRARLEGGGAFTHRPAFPGDGQPWHPERPRRFDPRSLPVGLRQVVGHTGHPATVDKLGEWAEAVDEDVLGRVRTLRVRDGHVSYALGRAPIADDEAGLWMIDGTMARCRSDAYEVLALDLP